MQYIVILLLILSTNTYAQFHGSGMGGKKHNKTSADQDNQPSQGTFAAGWAKRQQEIEAFDSNVLPLLKTKNIPEEKINGLRRLPPDKLGEELKTLGIDPNNIEVKDPAIARKSKKE